MKCYNYVLVYQAYIACRDVDYSMLQMIDIFGSLLERPLIKQDFDKNYPEIVDMMDRDVLDCKEIYDTAMEVRARFCAVLSRK